MFRTAAEIIDLPAAEAQRGYSVQLRGVITFFLPSSQLAFVQDETAGIYILPATWSEEFTLGDVVEIDGVTGSGRFSPIVQGARLRKTPERKLPVPKTIGIEQLNSGRFDAQWLQMEGVVENANYSDGVCVLELWAGGSSATVMVFDQKPVATNLVDALVRVEGVGGTFYQDDRLTSFGLFLPSSTLLKVVSPGKPPFEAPLRKVGALPWFSRDGGMDRRIQVQGTVTVAWPGEAVFLEDETGAIRASFRGQPARVLHPGDLVKAAGFVRDPSLVPRLSGTVIEKVGTAKAPEPTILGIKDLRAKPASGLYVSVEGEVSRVNSSESGLTLIDLEAGNNVITGLLPPHTPLNVRSGSRVRITGAWSTPPKELRNQSGPVVWLNSGANLTVLALPLVSSGVWHLNVLVACTVGALLTAAAMAVRCRRSSLRFAAGERAGGLRLAEVERELQRLKEARERLGRDLHDRIIQTIYAIGLNIEDCAQAVSSDAKIEGRLKSTLREINGVIGELRNVILGLEANAIQPRELRTALKSLAFALGGQESSRIRLDIQEEAVSLLTAAQATELVYIAREALSNSIRHGEAQTTTFGLEIQKDNLRFSIEDDGKGFVVKSGEGKGFGLRNMAKRAEGLGAIFRVYSEEGLGTRVLLDIPRQKTHFSIK